MPANDVVTNFSGYTLEQLNQMLDQSDPASGVNAAQMWESAGNLLHEQAQNLQSRLSSLRPAWSGSAAADYQRMIADLIGGIQTVGDIAFQMRNVMYNAVDALNTARAQLPPPVDVPSVSPATVATATTPIVAPAGASPQLVEQLQQQQAAAAQAVQQQQQAAAAAASAQAKAVAVMQALAGSYTTARESIPPSPAATAPAVHGPGPSSSAGLPGSGGLSPVWGTTVLDASQSAGTMPGATPSAPAAVAAGTAPGAMADGTGSEPTSLFGDMFTVGLAAAAAAAAGRFGSLMPRVPGLAKRRQDRKNTGRSGGGTPQLGEATPQLGGAAGAVAGSGLATAAVPGSGGPAAGPGMGGTGSGQLADLAASNAAGAAVGGSAGGEPMMPMMPMSGMAGAGPGNPGARRTPPWLVETQDVWGQSVPAAPGLID